MKDGRPADALWPTDAMVWRHTNALRVNAAERLTPPHTVPPYLRMMAKMMPTMAKNNADSPPTKKNTGRRMRMMSLELAVHGAHTPSACA